MESIKKNPIIKSWPYILLVALTIATIPVLKSKFLKSNVSTAIPQELNSETINLPVSPNNRAVANVYLTYNFTGPVEKIEEAKTGKKIVLNTSEKNLPDFILDDQTQISTADQNNKSKYLPGKIEDVKTNNHVSISVTYDLEKKTWQTRYVYVID